MFTRAILGSVPLILSKEGGRFSDWFPYIKKVSTSKSIAKMNHLSVTIVVKNHSDYLDLTNPRYWLKDGKTLIEPTDIPFRIDGHCVFVHKETPTNNVDGALDYMFGDKKIAILFQKEDGKDIKLGTFALMIGAKNTPTDHLYFEMLNDLPNTTFLQKVKNITKSELLKVQDDQVVITASVTYDNKALITVDFSDIPK